MPPKKKTGCLCREDKIRIVRGGDNNGKGRTSLAGDFRRSIFGDISTIDTNLIGQGAYGTVFRVGGRYEDWLQTNGCDWRPDSHRPHFIAVKVALAMAPTHSQNDLRLDNVQNLANPDTREAKIHRDITNKQKANGIKVLPELYCCFIASSSVPLVVTVMEYIDGETFYQRYQKVPITEDAFQQVEKLVTTLWTYGYFHGDLHWNNIMVTKGTQQLILLDVGRTTTVPSHMRDIADSGDWANPSAMTRMEDHAGQTAIVSNATRLRTLAMKVGETFDDMSKNSNGTRRRIANNNSSSYNSAFTPPQRQTTDGNTTFNNNNNGRRSVQRQNVPQSWNNNL
jgi:hypothetical protein